RTQPPGLRRSRLAGGRAAEPTDRAAATPESAPRSGTGWPALAPLASPLCERSDCPDLSFTNRLAIRVRVSRRQAGALLDGLGASRRSTLPGSRCFAFGDRLTPHGRREMRDPSRGCHRALL